METGEFAKLTGVTVRTLHHYDRLGLLKPGGRTAAGYRVYGQRDLERLEQIVVLKFLGLPLKEIRTLLDRRTPDLSGILDAQWRALAAKRSQLDAALLAIQAARNVLKSGEKPDLKSIIEAIEMQNDTEWMKQYYTDDAQRKVEERKALWSPELQAKVDQDWSELSRDIETAMAGGDDPSGPTAQALAQRWRQLVAGFTGGDPGIQSGLNAMHRDRKNWKVQFKMPYSDAAEEFITKAMQANR